MLCSTFKGTTPSELYDRYDGEGGYLRMEMDMMVAAEISDRIKEQHDEAQKKFDAKKAVANRDKKRAQMKGQELGSMLNDFVGE